MTLFTLLTLVACGADKAEDSAAQDSSDTGVDTSDSASDSATDTSDTQDTSDTTDTGVVEGGITWNIGTSVTGAAFGLFPLVFAADLEVAETPWWSTAVEGADRVVSTGEAPDASFAQDIPDFPDTTLAFFMPMVWDDADGNLLHDPGERFRASSRILGVYVDGALPAELASLGLVLGWNALRLDSGDGYPVPFNIANVPLPLNLDVRSTFPIGGTLEGLALDDDGLAVLSPAMFSTPGSAPLLTADAASPWTLTLDGAPPADHLMDIDGTGTLFAAVELVVSWQEADGNDGFTTYDAVSVACSRLDGEVRVAQVAWFGDVRDTRYATFFAWSDLHVGWNVMLPGEGDAVRTLSEDEAGALVIGDAACGA